MSTACLSTRVRNTSGATRYFGFLNKHGARLADGDELDVPGDLFEQVSRNERKRDALDAALTAGDLVVISTPAVHLYDLTDKDVKELKLDNGVLGISNPCWGQYASS